MRSKVAKSLVRADGVVGALPGTELTVEDGELEGVGDDFIELLGMGTLSALDMAVEFGGAGRQDEQQEAAAASCKGFITLRQPQHRFLNHPSN